MVDWETIEVPRGSFIGWGTKPGQTVVGKVVDYDVAGGTDFNGKTCPQIVVELTEAAESFNKAGDMYPYAAGELITVTAGGVDLGRKLRAADPALGDLVKIVMTGMEDLDGGRTVKRFTVQIARNKNKGPIANMPRKHMENAPGGGGAGFDQDDDAPPF